MTHPRPVEHVCPRRGEVPINSVFKYPATDTWNPHGCSYCGSISEEDFFHAIDTGCRLGPTDKNYKVYVHMPERSFSKFYFQHLSAEGKHRFIELYNGKFMNIGYPGHFYARPFFCAAAR